MFDFPDNETLQYVLQQFAEDGRVIGAVCHGPSGLVNVTYKDGTPLVKGKKVTSFTDEEERSWNWIAICHFCLNLNSGKRVGYSYPVKNGQTSRFVTGIW